MLKFKVGDTVKITSGKDKGREGKIEAFDGKKMEAFIPGINVYKKHIKAQMAKDGKGGIFELSRPVTVAKLVVVCPKCKKTTRVGFRVMDKEKVRVCVKCGKEIDTK